MLDFSSSCQYLKQILAPSTQCSFLSLYSYSIMIFFGVLGLACLCLEFGSCQSQFSNSNSLVTSGFQLLDMSLLAEELVEEWECKDRRRTDTSDLIRCSKINSHGSLD